MLRIIFLYCLLGFGTTASFAQTFVLDDGGYLTASEIELLQSQLAAYEDSTTNQIAIRTVRSLDGRDLESYANELFNELGLGQQGKDNGILVFAAREERALRIEVGYGLEPFVTDLDAKRIIDQALAPNFHDSSYYAGFANAVTLLIRQIARAKQQNTPALFSPEIIVDRGNLLTDEEITQLRSRCKSFREETGHCIFIRITQNNFPEADGAAFAEKLTAQLRPQTPESSDFTLVYIDVARFSGSATTFTDNFVRIDWPNLPDGAFAEDDHYAGRVGYYSQNLLTYRFELKVMFGYFDKEEYFEGLERVLDLIPKLMSGSIDSTGIDEKFFDSFLGKFLVYGLLCLAGMFGLGYLLHKAGFKPGPGSGGTGSSFKSYSSNRSSYDDDYGGGSSGGGGSGGGFGGAGFGGGSSGGGGASGSY